MMLKKLKNNKADVYIQFLIGFIIISIFLSFLIMLTEIQIMVDRVNDEVRTATNIVLTKMQKEHYDDFIVSDINVNNDIVTDDTTTQVITATELRKQLQKQLNAGYNNRTDSITKQIDTAGDRYYEISDINIKNETGDTSNLYITMKVTIPLKFGNITFSDYEKDLTYKTSLTIKEYETTTSTP